MLRILLPIDGSDASKATLHWSAGFLKNIRADVRVHLFVAVESLDVDYTIEGVQRILNDASQLMQQYGYEVEKADYLINQLAPEAICQYADTHAIDQIIIGSHGKQFAQRFIGSVSKAVFEKARQPVLLLKNTDTGNIDVSHYEAFHLRQSEALKLLVPVDRVDSVAVILESAGHLLSPAMAVHLLHVVEPPSAISAVKSAEEVDQDGADSLLMSNKEALEAAGFTNITTDTRLGKASEQICQYARDKQIDEIVMAAHSRSNLEKIFFGSTSQAVLHCAQKPVMVFNPDKKASLSIRNANRLNVREEAE